MNSSSLERKEPLMQAIREGEGAQALLKYVRGEGVQLMRTE